MNGHQEEEKKDCSGELNHYDENFNDDFVVLPPNKGDQEGHEKSSVHQSNGSEDENHNSWSDGPPPLGSLKLNSDPAFGHNHHQHQQESKIPNIPAENVATFPGLVP